MNHLLSEKPAQTTRLIFIRHGETDNNKNGRIQGRSVDSPLNELGVNQAKQVALALNTLPIEVIYTSSLRRTHETAKPLIESRSYILESSSGLDEMDFGDYEGLHFEAIKSELSLLQELWQKGQTNQAIAGGESPQAVFERSSSVVKEAISNYKGMHIAFFIHGRLSRILLSGLLGLGLHRMHEIEHCNGSINVIDAENDTFRACVLHYTDHLSLLNEIHS